MAQGEMDFCLGLGDTKATYMGDTTKWSDLWDSETYNRNTYTRKGYP